jgi:hypothetical protein
MLNVDAEIEDADPVTGLRIGDRVPDLIEELSAAVRKVGFKSTGLSVIGKHCEVDDLGAVLLGTNGAAINCRRARLGYR